jgi:uncharacterized protein YecT (DUF1311 family)
MREKVLLALIVLLLSPSSHATTDCLDSAPTQADMNRCACDEAKRAEAALQAEYQALIDRDASDSEVHALIREARGLRPSRNRPQRNCSAGSKETPELI